MASKHGNKKKKPAHLRYNNKATVSGWNGGSKTGKKHRTGKHIHA